MEKHTRVKIENNEVPHRPTGVPHLRRGISLVESSVAVVLMATLTLGVVGAMHSVGNRAVTTSRSQIAGVIAHQQIERLRSAGPAAYPMPSTVFNVTADGTHQQTGQYAVNIVRSISCVPGVPHEPSTASRAPICGDTAVGMLSYSVYVAFVNNETKRLDSAKTHVGFLLDTTVAVAAPVAMAPPVLIAPIVPVPAPISPVEPLSPPAGPIVPAGPIAPVTPKTPAKAKPVSGPSITVVGPAILAYGSSGSYIANVLNMPGSFTVQWSGTADPKTLLGLSTSVQSLVGQSSAYGGKNEVQTTLTATLYDAQGNPLVKRDFVLFQQTCGVRQGGGEQVGC